MYAYIARVVTVAAALLSFEHALRIEESSVTLNCIMYGLYRLQTLYSDQYS